MLHDRERPLLIEALEADKGVVTAGVIVCVINLAAIPQALQELIANTSTIEQLEHDPQIPALLHQVQIWIVEENTLKLNEQAQKQQRLHTPLQETRREDEYLQHALAGALTEELPRQNGGNVITYQQGVSYLGHGWLPFPYANNQSLNFRYRADYFLVAYAGSQSNGEAALDSEVHSLGWQTIDAYLAEGVARRQGGAEVVRRSLNNLLQFLFDALKHPDRNQFSPAEIAKIYAGRGTKDFKINPATRVAAAAAASSPSS